MRAAYLRETSLPAPIRHALSRLEEAGYPSYLVGGCVRDLLMGREPHDFDVTTAATPDRTLQVFRDFTCVETGIRHGTVGVLVDGMWCEITTFRTDGAYLDSRHPSEVCFTPRVEDDLARRDFTVNAMAWRPCEGRVLDLHGGLADLEAGVLRCVGDPRRRFGEDALRILRAFRFAAKLSFVIEPETLRMAGACAEGLRQISAERIHSELTGLLTAPDPLPALSAMRESGVMSVLLPELEGVPLWSLATLPREAAMRYAGLFFSLSPEEAAAVLVRHKSARALQHEVRGLLTAARALPVESAVAMRRFRRDHEPYVPGAIELFASLSGCAPEAGRQLRALYAQEKNAVCRMADLAVGGAELRALGFDGAALGRALETLLEQVIEHPETNEAEALLARAKALL